MPCFPPLSPRPSDSPSYRPRSAEEFGADRGAGRKPAETVEPGVVAPPEELTQFDGAAAAEAAGKNFGKEALIGLKSGHGDSFFYAPPEARAVAFMLETAAECGFNSRLLSAGCDDEREAKVELINSHVDGVLCYNTQPWFTRSAAALLPTVLLYNREAGVPCVMFDGNLAACQLLAMLQQSQIHTVGWDGMPDQLYHLQIRNFLESSGIRNLDLPLRSMGSALEYLTDFCTTEKIGCVICDGGFSPVLQAIEQRSGKLFLKIFMTRSLHPGTNAWLLSTDVRGACATACRMLKDLLNGKPVSDQIRNLELVSLAQ